MSIGTDDARGALIAGVMGMNFRVGLFDEAQLFWVCVALILAVAA